ncbi:hypothetical protein F5877DRAFT_71332 [Lentinula edodes]|nr:hypothetical protein F5877DRAFT_71332 [Lentinula edodes]
MLILPLAASFIAESSVRSNAKLSPAPSGRSNGEGRWGGARRGCGSGEGKWGRGAGGKTALHTRLRADLAGLGRGRDSGEGRWGRSVGAKNGPPQPLRADSTQRMRRYGEGKWGGGEAQAPKMVLCSFGDRKMGKRHKRPIERFPKFGTEWLPGNNALSEERSQKFGNTVELRGQSPSWA